MSHGDGAAPSGRRSPIIAVILLIVFAATMAGVFPFRQIIAQKRQVAVTQETYDVLAEQNRLLEQEIAALHTPVEIERLARENYGLVRPGEVGYRVVGSDAPEPIAVTAPPDEVVIDERTWWQRFTDFLTGRDLDPNG